MSPDSFHTGCWLYLVQLGTFHMSGGLQVVDSPRKIFRDELEWEQSKFYAGREKDRGQGLGTTTKEAESKGPSGHQPTYE